RHQLPSSQRQRNAVARTAVPVWRRGIDATSAPAVSALPGRQPARQTRRHSLRSGTAFRCLARRVASAVRLLLRPLRRAARMMFEPIYRSRPGADALSPASADAAEQIAPGLWCSPGLSNAYLLTTDEGRVIVNTGMGFEGPVHRANFDAVDSSPVRYIVFTQGHVDHVGGLDSVRDPDTVVVAQANWTMW